MAEREELIAVFEAVWPSEGAPFRPGPSACVQERPCRIFAVRGSVVRDGRSITF
jgi:hypothetical protein